MSSVSNGNHGDTTLCPDHQGNNTYTTQQHVNMTTAMPHCRILDLDERPILIVQPCVAMDISMHEGNDDKKRPLSVSSVSSSVSSSSSLPRHQRKKMATCIVTSQGTPTSQVGLNSVDSIEEDYVQNEILHTNVSENISICKTAADWIANDSSNITNDDVMAINTLVSENSESSFVSENSIGIARDLTENYSQNSSSDISDLSNLSTTSYPIDDDAKSQKSETDTCTKAPEDIRRRTAAKPYVPLCDPHGRAPRTTQPSVTTQETLFESARAWSSHTYKVIQEILTTERVYVRDLQDIVQGYVGFLTECEEIDGRLTKHDLRRLFGNITSIHTFNRELLDNLEQCGCDPVKIAQCFVDKKDGFKIYTEYCTNYPSSVEVLTQVMCDSDLADIFKTQQVRLAHGLPLGSFLLKPVQRILKYHLLLQNLLNNFDVRQAGYETVRRALQCMTNVAHHTNEMKRRHERAVHIQEIQSLLFGWAGDDLTTYGDLLLEDTFRMHGAKAYRHLYLFEKVVILAKKKEDGNLLVKESIQCSNLMLIESVPKEPLSFHVIPFNNPRMQYTVQSRSLEQKHKWCQQIKSLILENFNAVIPDKAKHLVMTLGKSKEEQQFAESQTEDSGAPKKQHTAPEYLERRRQRRKSSTLLDMSLIQKGQKVFRMRRQSSAEGRSPDSATGGPKLEKKSSSFENMVELDETLQEQDEGEHCLPKANSIESLHSTEYTSPIQDHTSQHSSPNYLCSAAQSTHRVQSRDLLDEIETSERPSSNCAHQSNCPHNLRTSQNDSSSNILPSNCIATPCKQTESVEASAKSKRVPQRDSLLFIDDNDTQLDDLFIDNTFLKELSNPNDSLLKAVSDCTGITLPDPEESCTDPVLQQKLEDACVVLPHLKESRIGSDSNAECDSEVNTSCHSDLSKHNAVGGSLCKKPPLSVKNSSCKNRLLTADKSVQDRILFDSDVTGSLEMLGVSTKLEKRLSGDSNVRSPKTISLHSDSQSSLNSTNAVRVFSDINIDGSRQHLNETESTNEINPWTLRKDLKNRLRRSKESAQRKTSDDRRRSRSNVGDVSLLKSLISNTKNLVRASSCSSLEGKDETNPETMANTNAQDTVATSGTVTPEPGLPIAIPSPIEGQSPVISHKSSPLKKPGGSNSFRDKIRNIVTQQRQSKSSRYATPPCVVMQSSYDESLIVEIIRHDAEPNQCETSEMETVLGGNLSISMCSDSKIGGSKSNTLESQVSSFAGHDQEDMELEVESRDRKNKQTVNKGTIPKNTPRPRSFENVEYCASPPQTPSSATSNESIMHSLKNAVASLTSRITRMGNSATRSAYSSPTHDGSFVRSRSVGAENDARIKPTIIDPLSPQFALTRASPPRTIPGSKHTKERQKEKRNKFVYNLQRAYSERVKKRNRTTSASPTGRRNSKLFLQEQGLLNSTTSISTAERLADTKPQGMGSYTLRKPKAKQKGKKSDKKTADCGLTCDMENNCGATTYKPDAQHEAGSVLKLDETKDLPKLHQQDLSEGTQNKCDFSNPPTPNLVINAFKKFHDSNPSLRDGICLPSDVIDLIGQSPFEDCISLQSYYENTLEANLDSDLMKESTMYVDDSGPASFESESNSLIYIPEVPLATIFDTVQEFGKTSQESELYSDMKLVEQSNSIQNVMQNLEIASKSPETPTHQAHKVLVQSRKRELKECAMLSRIRQNSCDGTIDGENNRITVSDNNSFESNSSDENTPVCTCSLSENNDNSIDASGDECTNDQYTQNCPVHSSPRKGWVKQVINQIQSGYLSAEN